MRVGVGIGTALMGILGGDAGVALGPAFVPSNLFIASETGAFYDPSDLTSLYSSRLGLGEPFRVERQRNLLLNTENMGAASWNKVGGTAVSSPAVSPNGVPQSHAIIEDGANTGHGFTASTNIAFDTTVTLRLVVKRAAGTRNLRYTLYTATSGLRATINLDAQTVTNGSYGTGVYTSGSCVALTGGWFLVTITGKASTNESSPVYTFEHWNGAAVIFTGDSTSGFHYAEQQLEQGSAPTAYQRVGASFDYIDSPVGIMLDKSRMGAMSAAAYIAGRPASALLDMTTAGWTTLGCTVSQNGSGLNFAFGATNDYAFKTFTTVVGRTYEVRAACSGHGRNISISLSGLGGPFFYAAAPSLTTIVFTAAQTTYSFGVASATGAGTTTISSVEFREIPGFHAVAPSDAARPILRMDADPTIMAAQPELATWGTFTTQANVDVVRDREVGAAGTLSSGRLRVTNNAAYQGRVGDNGLALTPGRWYRITGTVSASSDAGPVGRVSLGGDASLNFTAPTPRTDGVTVAAGSAFTLLAFASPLNSLARIGFWNMVIGGTAWVEYDNVSVKEIPLSAYRLYLETDGVDDWMQVLPACNLGTTWSHFGGWQKTVAGGTFPFGLSAAGNAGIYTDNSAIWYVYDSTSTLAVVSPTSTALNTTYVYGVESAAGGAHANVIGRVNGVNGTSRQHFDDTVSAQGLALFSRDNTAFSIGMAGRFYGGVWINRALTTGERGNLELFQASSSGVTL